MEQHLEEKHKDCTEMDQDIFINDLYHEFRKKQIYKYMCILF